MVCDEDAYLLELVRYIHLNPLRAGLVSNLDALNRYDWSGHAVIMGKSVLEGQVTDEVLVHFAKGKRESRRQYLHFVADGVVLGKREDLGGGRKKPVSPPTELGDVSFDARILGGGDFVDKLRLRGDLKTKLPSSLQISDIVFRVCQHFGVDQQELRLNTRAMRIADARAVICYLAVRQTDHNGVEVGSQVNLGRAGVSAAASRGGQMVKNNPALLTLVDK